MANPLLDLLGRLDRAFGAVGLRYQIGGSVASVVHGEARTTQDVDVLVDLAPWHLDRLAAALPELSLDVEAARHALAQGRAFQAVDPVTGWKLDVFPVRDDVDAAELGRRVRLPLEPSGATSACFATAEDIVLRKLAWFRASGGVLDRQLRDVGGVLRVQRERLDRPYLREMARRRGLAELLARAFKEAGFGDV